MLAEPGKSIDFAWAVRPAMTRTARAIRPRQQARAMTAANAGQEKSVAAWYRSLGTLVLHCADSAPESLGPHAGSCCHGTSPPRKGAAACHRGKAPLSKPRPIDRPVPGSAGPGNSRCPGSGSSIAYRERRESREDSARSLSAQLKMMSQAGDLAAPGSRRGPQAYPQNRLTATHQLYG